MSGSAPSVYRTCWPLVVGMFALGIDSWAVAGFLPALAEDVGVRVSIAGLSVSFFAIVYAIAGPIAVGRTAHLPRKTVLIAALGVLAVADVLLALAGSFAAVLACRALAAVAAAVINPTSGAFAAAVVAPRQRSAALALVFTGMTLAIAVGVPLGAVAADRLSWRVVVAGVSVLAIVAAALVAWWMPSTQGTVRTRGTDYAMLLRDTSVILTCVLTAVAVAASYVLYTYSAEVTQALALDMGMLPALLACFGVGAVIGNHAAGYLTERWGPTWFERAGLAMLVVTMLALGLGPGAVLAPVVFLLWGIAAWGYGAPQQQRLHHLQPERSALVFSLNASALYLGIALGTASGGFFVERGIPLRGTLVAIAFAMVALVLNEVVGRRGVDPPRDDRASSAG